MNFYIIMPAHNEADCIAATLESLVQQSCLPKRLVVVNDHSTDATASIVAPYAKQHDWIELVHTTSSEKHLPGAKIITAFYAGYDLLDIDYDVICKFDADLIFPKDYLQALSSHFKNNSKLGMAAGVCHIKKKGLWVLENLTRSDHIRGPIKAYRKACFMNIGQLKISMGWDTVDELLARYHGWELCIDKSLVVKHLKPTGAHYHKASRYMQGEAMYKLRYGLTITIISAIKLAYRKHRIELAVDYIKGYFKARRKALPYLVTKSEGRFIRQVRWRGILEKLTL